MYGPKRPQKSFAAAAKAAAAAAEATAAEKSKSKCKSFWWKTFGTATQTSRIHVLDEPSAADAEPHKCGTHSKASE